MNLEEKTIQQISHELSNIAKKAPAGSGRVEARNNAFDEIEKHFGNYEIEQTLRRENNKFSIKVSGLWISYRIVSTKIHDHSYEANRVSFVSSGKYLLTMPLFKVVETESKWYEIKKYSIVSDYNRGSSSSLCKGAYVKIAKHNKNPIKNLMTEEYLRKSGAINETETTKEIVKGITTVIVNGFYKHGNERYITMFHKIPHAIKKRLPRTFLFSEAFDLIGSAVEIEYREMIEGMINDAYKVNNK